MKKILLSVSCLMAAFLTSAQTPRPTYQWAKNMGGTNDDFGLATAMDASGNVYTTGFFQGTADLDPGSAALNFTSAGSDDVFITKLDASGNLVWSKKVGSSGSDKGGSIAVDGSGNVYTTGWFNNTVDFDPGTGTANLTSAGGTDAFILKLDASGNFVWVAKIGGSTGDDNGRGIYVDASGNSYTTGNFRGATNFTPPGTGSVSATAMGTSDAFATKLDASGNLIWSKTWGGASANTVGFSIDTDTPGNIYINGNFSGTVDMDPGVGTATISSVAGSADIFTSKLDASGNYVWAKNIIASTGVDYVSTFKVDAAGNSYATGQYVGTADADPSPTTTLNIVSNGGYDAYISKIDASGSLVWAKSIGGSSDDVGRSVALDGLNNVYIIGGFTGSNVDLDPSSTASYTVSSSGSSDVFILNLDGSGNYVWGGKIGSTGYDDGFYITSDASGNLFATGTFQSTTDFNTGPKINNLTSAGANDIFIMKLIPCAVPNSPTSSTPTGNQSVCVNNTTTLTATSTGTVTWYTTPTSTLVLGTGTSYITPTLAVGNYTYYAESATCAPSDTRTAFTLTVNPQPVVISNNGVICSGQTFTIIPSGASTYVYSGGSNTVTPTANTFYSVIGTDANGCSSLPSVSNVTVLPSPNMLVATTKTILCVGETATLSVTGAITYTWNNTSNNTSITVSPTVTTLYTVIGTGTNACTSSISYTQTVSPCTGVEELASSTVLNLYPNPSSGEFTINLPEQAFITIYDALGKIVLSQEFEEGKHSISLKEQPNGLYLLKTTIQEKNQSIRLIKY